VDASADNNHVTFNVIDQNGSPAAGIGQSGVGGVVLSTDSNVIAFNAISRNLQSGVILTGGAKNIVRSNVITQTSGPNGAGITILMGSTSNFLVGNIALANEARDLDYENPNCDHNKSRDNTFRTSIPASCIH
jgi:hypothetical protein